MKGTYAWYGKWSVMACFVLTLMLGSRESVAKEVPDFINSKDCVRCYVMRDKVYVTKERERQIRTVDLGQLLYRVKDSMYEKIDCRYESFEDFDWLHIVDCIGLGENEILLFSQTLSSYIAIKNIYSDPQIHYIIGANQVWEEYAYQYYLLNLNGEKAVIFKEGEIRSIQLNIEKPGVFTIFAMDHDRFTYREKYHMQVDLIKAKVKLLIP